MSSGKQHTQAMGHSMVRDMSYPAFLSSSSTDRRDSLRSMEDSQDGNGRSVLTGADASCAGTARSPTAAGRGIV